MRGKGASAMESLFAVYSKNPFNHSNESANYNNLSFSYFGFLIFASHSLLTSNNLI